MSDGISIVFIILDIIVALGLIITNLVFSFKYEAYEIHNEKIVSYIHETLNTKFIYDFNPRIKCKEGEEKLILGTWDGTIDKCQWWNYLKDYACTKEDKDCQTIAGVKPKNYTVSGGKEICVVRKGETYYNLVKSGKIISKDKNCPENEKSCGIVDTLERKLCVNKDEDCPLNITSIDKEYEEININKLISKINLDNDIMNFLDETIDNNKIISIIKISDGLPCLNISEKNWKSYHPEEKYKNEKCYPINGKTLDDRYQKFEKFYTKKLDLYKDNDLGDYITDLLRNDETIINLYGMNLIGIDVEEEGFNYDKIISFQELSNSCGKAMYIIAYIIIGTLVSPFVYLIKSCDSNSSLGEGGIAIFCIICAILCMLGLLIDFILCIIIYVSNQKIEWLLKDSLNIEDNAIKELINELIENHSSNYSYSLAIIILFVIFALCGIAVLIIFCIKDYY